ncbi:hypothetical protein Tco_0818883 [Tanacetum coccineum]
MLRHEARKPGNIRVEDVGEMIELENANFARSNYGTKGLEPRCERNPILNGKSCNLNALGTNLDMSTAYHPQTDGQSERNQFEPRGYNSGREVKRLKRSSNPIIQRFDGNSKRGPEFQHGEREDQFKKK